MPTATPHVDPAGTTGAAGPAASSLSPLRAYLEVVSLFVVVFGARVLRAVFLFFGQYGLLPAWTGGWRTWVAATHDVGLLAAAVWLSALLLHPAARRLLEPQRVLAAVVTLAAAGVVVVAEGRQWWFIAMAVLACGLAALLTRRRGLNVWPAGRGSNSTHVLWSSFGGVIATAVAVNLAYAVGVPAPGAAAATSSLATPADVAALLPRMASAAVVEELAVVAVVVTLLGAAGRPAWEIYALSLTMRISYHLYYGLLAPSVLVFGAVNLALYRRHRRLAPLVGAHLLFNLATAMTALGGPYTYAGSALVAATALTTTLLPALSRRRAAANSRQDTQPDTEPALPG